MTYTADLHTHSSYAYATSPALNFPNIAHWARLKGIDLLASADFTHPDWFARTRDTLADLGNGLFEYGGVNFILGTEVSCVARVGGRSRRVHLLAFAPSLDAVETVNARLAATGAKLNGDGRPTLTVTPRDFTAIMLDADPRCFVIPAHVWTPWFGLFGSKSGFDSLEECFGDMTPHIRAVETGLSSDPAMCWRVPDLDRLSIVSFSDAHSLPKLARELTVFEGELSYDGLVAALESQRIAYTLEFFPEEGKYHNSGHRKCGVSLDPDGVAANGRACPKCQRPMTLGVTQRVEELAARPTAALSGNDGMIAPAANGGADGNRPPFRSLVSLDQALSEAIGVGVNTKRVRTAYTTLVDAFGSELSVLLDAPIPHVATALQPHGPRIAEAIRRIRAGDIHIQPGFDGQYGAVKIWPD